MCLYAHNTTPLVCGKDLVVYKMLRKYGGDIYTPYQNAKAELGSYLKAEEEFPSLPSDYSNNNIENGAIHASLQWRSCQDYLMLNRVEGTCERIVAKAVIKAGTPFFVDFRMNDIAAKEMLVTSTTVPFQYGTDTEYGKDISETNEAVRELIMKQPFMKNSEGVRAGDVLLSDKTFAHCEEIEADAEAIGVVAFIRPDGTPQVISLRQKALQWFSKKPCDYPFPTNPALDRFLAVNDFDGFGHTQKILKNQGEMINDFPAFKYCLDYSTPGTEAGDWYLPSSGELIQAIRNTFFINEAIAKLPSDPLRCGKSCWSSTEKSFEKLILWVNTLGSAQLVLEGGWNIAYARPMLRTDWIGK